MVPHRWDRGEGTGGYARGMWPAPWNTVHAQRVPANLWSHSGLTFLVITAHSVLLALETPDSFENVCYYY